MYTKVEYITDNWSSYPSNSVVNGLINFVAFSFGSVLDRPTSDSSIMQIYQNVGKETSINDV